MIINNRYQILRSLGSGGFGETFIAEDTQMPSGRWCVLKKLRPVTTDHELYQLIKDRFKREAVILEDLGNQCDQIPTLYAYFEEDNNFYLVQALIDGITLNELVKQQSSFCENYVRDFLSNFLPVLDYVHAKHIIHRDIKPDNIIMRRQDSKPVLIDFGAVKEAMSTNIGTVGNSTNTIMIGTPAFMPSEQAAGRPVYSSDLYAMGLTAIYLLTGKEPQNIETDYSTGEILWQQYAPSVSPAFATILSKIISSHARDRYATAQEIIQALQSETSQFDPTIIVSPRHSLSQSVVSRSVYKFGEFQKTLLIGGFLALGIILGFWLTRQPQQSTQNIAPQTTPTSSPLASKVSPYINPSANMPLVGTIVSKATGRVLDAGGKNGDQVYMYPNLINGNPWHQWRFVPVRDSYILISVATGKALDAGGANGTSVYPHPSPNQNNKFHLWKITQVGDSYILINNATGKALDAGGANGTLPYPHSSPNETNNYHLWRINLSYPSGVSSQEQPKPEIGDNPKDITTAPTVTDNSKQVAPTETTKTSPPIVNTPNPPVIEVLNEDEAKQVIHSLYGHLSRQEWNKAKNQFTPELSSQLDPNFFKQFKQITVENLNLTSKTDTSISFIGTNTYFYPDGSKQTEERSYTVEIVNKVPLISASEFIRVIKSR